MNKTIKIKSIRPGHTFNIGFNFNVAVQWEKATGMAFSVDNVQTAQQNLQLYHIALTEFNPGMVPDFDTFCCLLRGSEYARLSAVMVNVIIDFYTDPEAEPDEQTEEKNS